jgi:hypothetical protein
MDNRELILPLLKFDNGDMFYFIQIYQRRRDNPGMSQDMRVLGNYAVHSIEQFDKFWPEIKKICDDNNARAYIRLNRRSDKKVALQMLARMATMIASEQYNVKNLYWSIAGEFHSEKDKTWLLDIDYIDYENETGRRHLDAIENQVLLLQREAGKEPLIRKIPSKNGYHIIARPFNIDKIKNLLANIERRMDIHKDNPTILYTGQDDNEN